ISQPPCGAARRARMRHGRGDRGNPVEVASAARARCLLIVRRFPAVELHLAIRAAGPILRSSENQASGSWFDLRGRVFPVQGAFNRSRKDRRAAETTPWGGARRLVDSMYQTQA